MRIVSKLVGFGSTSAHAIILPAFRAQIYQPLTLAAGNAV
jgi:hypothetical protein